MNPESLPAVGVNYNIGGIDILLPEGHPLPGYQANYRRYDRFLPYIVKRLPKESGVIDIGANCGDTLASIIAAGPELKYLCVEPSDNYFRYLEENIRRTHIYFPEILILTSKCLVGVADGDYLLSENAGTATALKVGSANGLNAGASMGLTKTKLTDLIQLCGEKFKPKLIKIDVDGFDFDVINSGSEIIKAEKPILFFECNPTSEEGFQAYMKTIESLSGVGYKNFSIFDNFGEFIFSTQEAKILPDLMRYFLKQNTRTFYYIDILAAAEADAPLIESAIDEFNKTKF